MRSARVVFAAVLLAAQAVALGDTDTQAQRRQQATKLFKSGNYKEALSLFKQLATDPATDDVAVSSDLSQAIDSQNRLGLQSEFDELVESSVRVNAGNWRLLAEAARLYSHARHHGFIVSGKFQRGHHRGGGRYVNAARRDTRRALQLLHDAVHAADEAPARDKARLLLQMADLIASGSGHNQAWRLQYLSDLGTLPDYDEGYRWGGSRTAGAPVDEAGDPVVYTVPKSYEAARSDGERWRWLLQEAAELDPSQLNSARKRLADFLFSQFGVHTLARHPILTRGSENSDGDEATGPYTVHTLQETETIAKLATGVKRFDLPPEANYIRLYRQIAADPKSGHGEEALDSLARIFENRRQYDAAAKIWKRSVAEYGPGGNNRKQNHIDQILGNWGQFEPTMTHPAGETATLMYRFRNAHRVTFTAKPILIESLLSDVQNYLKSNPSRLDHNKVNIDRIGYRLVTRNESKYVGDEVATWSVDLDPDKASAPHHDRNVEIETPLKEAGAYLVTAHLNGGNTCKIVVWIDNTVIVRKQLDGNAYFFAADAVTGAPLADAALDFFGYKQERPDPRKQPRRYVVRTQTFSATTDKDGQVVPNAPSFPSGYQWLITLKQQDRLAYLGFTGIWNGRYRDRNLNRAKLFTITDRPVYRPGDTVNYKLWYRQARYDLQDASNFAYQQYLLEMRDARNEKVVSELAKTDAYGGIEGTYVLPDDAPLGVYRFGISGKGWGTFRVEEYKKPEYEVTVEAPSEPIALGDVFEAKVTAKYYFGAPVTDAKIKYKVLRHDHSAQWFPPMPWDWLYGQGYWWFGQDYTWYPKWDHWGCVRPRGWWWPAPHNPPEEVASGEAELSEDGTFVLRIDTALAAATRNNTDHRYEITAEVTDQSRRTIVGTGEVLAARKPFKVYAWVDRGYYEVGDTVRASFSARTPDGNPVQGKGRLDLLRISYPERAPVETRLDGWDLSTDAEGKAEFKLKAADPGQYRLSYTLTDKAGHTIEGGYVFNVVGNANKPGDFRFNAIELVADKTEYAPGDTVRLLINTERANSTVVLFLRPVGGVYLPPEIIRMDGKSALKTFSITQKDMPNIFVEAFTVSDGKLHSQTRELVVPPAKRVVNVVAEPLGEKHKPGDRARVRLHVTELDGKPFVGSLVVSVYDKAVEYISGGSNVADIKEFFWKWRRRHHPSTISSLNRQFRNLTPPNEKAAATLGVFGHIVQPESRRGMVRKGDYGGGADKMLQGNTASLALDASMPMAAKAAAPPVAMEAMGAEEDSSRGAAQTPAVTVRSEFADTAYWNAALATDEEGVVDVSFDLPDNLTTWRIKTWAMGHGTRVGEGQAELVVSKDLLVRLQAPRFFVQNDEVTLSANVHSYLSAANDVAVSLELEGGCLEPLGDTSKRISLEPGAEHRVDWRVKVTKEGEALVRIKAVGQTDADAMELRFPVYVHGMLKTESFCGVVRPDRTSAAIEFMVPEARRADQSHLELRYSPTLAGAMVDALPYLADYPYGCTEQTLNRFLPSVITQKILQHMGLNLAAIRDKKTNLNAQEIGDDRQRARERVEVRQERRLNPVFDEAVLNDMVSEGIARLGSMQLSDGGWGWFSGWGERSYPHTTAVIVHGLRLAAENDVEVDQQMRDRGVAWLKTHQDTEVTKLSNAATKTKPWKTHADNTDAMVYRVLSEHGIDNGAMRDFLLRDRTHLSVYGKALFALGLQCHGNRAEVAELIRNIEQFLVLDDENQTAWLKLPTGGYWWYWYGSDTESHAAYLQLLARTNPHAKQASMLVKYMLNNRRHGTYWKSTRDTAICVEALAEYMKVSGEDTPDMTVRVLVDGKLRKEERITADNLFLFDNRFIMSGASLTTGRHRLEVKRDGRGPVYFNAYLTNFTTEDFITQAGLEIKIGRKAFKLVKEDKQVKAVGDRGQALDQQIESYKRVPLHSGDALVSGDLVEVELTVESKNDYEYIVLEDYKAAGFEPVDVRSGYSREGGLSAYREFRDERVAFFVRSLARGTHSLSYRLRAEIPGKFSALPARASAMYAPELKANSDEIKLSIMDE